MTKQVGVVLLAVGGALFAVGLILGFTQVTVSGAECGRVFQSGQTSFGYEIRNTLSGNPVSLVGDCSDARNSRVPIAWSVLIAGVIIGVGGGVIVKQSQAAQLV